MAYRSQIDAATERAVANGASVDTVVPMSSATSGRRSFDGLRAKRRRLRTDVRSLITHCLSPRDGGREPMGQTRVLAVYVGVAPILVAAAP